MLKDFIDKNKVFKLVCGAGNECGQDVERLVALYSKAGATMFDICAKPEILLSAKRGLEKSEIKADRYICVSVGMKGDPHIFKAQINSLCTQCGECEHICPNNAIINSNVEQTKCIGCTKCKTICKHNAVDMTEHDINLNNILPELVKIGIDCIELHATSDIESDIWDKWETINKYFNGILSICIDRLNLGNKQTLERIKKMIKHRKPYTTIIQADGIPMSGSDDTFKTTLQAVAMAEIIQNANLPVYLFISGGTNSKTAELAKLCNIRYNGVAIGSYARKIVKPFTEQDNFYSEMVFNKGLSIAKQLLEKSLYETK